MMQEAVNKGLFLDELEPNGPRLPNMDAIYATGAEIAAGMAFLHARGVVHGDLTGGKLKTFDARP